MIVILKFCIEFRMPRFKLLRFFKKGFRGHRKEFRRISGAVAVQRAFSTSSGFINELRIFLPEDSRPVDIGRPLRKNGGAVRCAVFLIQLMCKFVQGYVMTIEDIACAAQNTVPCQHHNPAVPRFAQPGALAIIPAEKSLLSALVRVRINKNGFQSGIYLGFVADQQQAGPAQQS